MHAFCSPQKVDRRMPGQVSWLRERSVWLRAASPSPADAEWCIEAARSLHSGGTAPDSHRTSLLGPRGHPSGDCYTTVVSFRDSPCVWRLRCAKCL